MGHFNPGGDSQIVQSIPVFGDIIFGSPVYWGGPDGPRIYVWPNNDVLREFAMSGGMLDPTPVATGPSLASFPGGMLAVSAAGDAAGTGIVWALTPSQALVFASAAPGTLHAFDASDVSRELWNSDQLPARDALGDLVKFCPPTVAGGRVYAATSSGVLQVYGLLNGGSPPADAGLTDQIVPSLDASGVGLGDAAIAANIDGSVSAADAGVGDAAPPDAEMGDSALADSFDASTPMPDAGVGNPAVPDDVDGTVQTDLFDEFARTSLGPYWSVALSAFAVVGGAAVGTAPSSYAEARLSQRPTAPSGVSGAH
jgi:hypothetical protein